jgi:hypothetical protein
MVMQTANMHDIYPLSLINAFFFSFWDKFLQEDRNVIFMIEDIPRYYVRHRLLYNMALMNVDSTYVPIDIYYFFYLFWNHIYWNILNYYPLSIISHLNSTCWLTIGIMWYHYSIKFQLITNLNYLLIDHPKNKK